MSSKPSRVSIQATIAPPSPVAMMSGSCCSPRRAHTARPFAGYAESSAPDARTCWAKMSNWVTSKTPCQATIAPPAPSEAMTWVVCSEGAKLNEAPPTGHAGSRTPEANRCWARMLWWPLLPPPHATIAPLAPSAASVGLTSSVPPMDTSRPLVGQPGAIAPEINARCA